MKFRILHEIKGRIRIHIEQTGMSFQEADILQYYLSGQKCVTSVKVYERTCDAAICYVGEREELLRLLQGFDYSRVQVPEAVLQNTGREVNREYWDITVKIILRDYAAVRFLQRKRTRKQTSFFFRRP